MNVRKRPSYIPGSDLSMRDEIPPMEIKWSELSTGRSHPDPEEKYYVQEKITCANHAEKTVILTQVSFLKWTCPECGDDYSIGRKVHDFV